MTDSKAPPVSTKVTVKVIDSSPYYLSGAVTYPTMTISLNQVQTVIIPAYTD